MQNDIFYVTIQLRKNDGDKINAITKAKKPNINKNIW